MQDQLYLAILVKRVQLIEQGCCLAFLSNRHPGGQVSWRKTILEGIVKRGQMAKYAVLFYQNDALETLFAPRQRLPSIAT